MSTRTCSACWPTSIHIRSIVCECSRRTVRCSYVQDGSLADLLEQLQKDKAHLPVQDVLSIFFQVLHKYTTDMPWQKAHHCVTLPVLALCHYTDGCQAIKATKVLPALWTVDHAHLWLTFWHA